MYLQFRDKTVTSWMATIYYLEILTTQSNFALICNVYKSFKKRQNM